VQGGTISLLVPTLAVLNLPELQCPEPEVLEEMSFENRTELWQSRMRVLSGAISVAAIIQVIIGLFGKILLLLAQLRTVWNASNIFSIHICPFVIKRF
jgi:nucleobase transporter 1/2